MPDQPPKPPRDIDVRPERRLGRTLSIVLYWVMTAYIVGGAALSILPAIYWPAHAPRPDHPRTLECARDIDALERELTQHAAAGMQGQPRAARETWLTTWDRRYTALGNDCGPLESARRDLGALRAAIDALLTEHEHDTARARERVRRAVEAFLAADREEKS